MSYEDIREYLRLLLKQSEANPQTVGKLIALYERAVGLYGSLVNTNAYHQPGVEAGKKAAEAVLYVQREAVKFLNANKGKAFGAEAIAAGMAPNPALVPDPKNAVETVFKTLRHLAANKKINVVKAACIFEDTYSV